MSVATIVVGVIAANDIVRAGVAPPLEEPDTPFAVATETAVTGNVAKVAFAIEPAAAANVPVKVALVNIVALDSLVTFPKETSLAVTDILPDSA